MNENCHEGTLARSGPRPDTATLLRAAGWDVIHVMEIGQSRADDAEIVDFARRNGRVRVIFDHDFHSHLALTRADGPSVIRIRAESLDSAGQADLIKQVYAFCGEAIESGAAVSVDKSTLRVRRLPLK